MDITIARPHQTTMKRVALVLSKVAISATAVYVLCVVAPQIYSASSAMRALARENANSTMLRGEILSRLRAAQRTKLVEADARKSPDERMAYLSRALKTANLELEGYQQRLQQAQSTLHGNNTFFHRTTGNKLLAFAQAEVNEHEVLVALAASHVAQLNRAQKSSEYLAQIVRRRSPDRSTLCSANVEPSASRPGD